MKESGKCFRFTILGQPPSKSNGYKMTCKGKFAVMYKSAALKAYEESFFLQCPARKLMLERFKISIDVFFSSNRPDADGVLKVILDSLQDCGAIVNDRGCVELHVRKFVDKENPRAEITLEEV